MFIASNNSSLPSTLAKNSFLLVNKWRWYVGGILDFNVQGRRRKPRNCFVLIKTVKCVLSEGAAIYITANEPFQCNENQDI